MRKKVKVYESAVQLIGPQSLPSVSDLTPLMENHRASHLFAAFQNEMVYAIEGMFGLLLLFFFFRGGC